MAGAQGQSSNTSVRIDRAPIEAVAKALQAEMDGGKLRRDLLRELRDVQRPLVQELRASALSIPSHGLGVAGRPLRQEIARSIKPLTRVMDGNPVVAVDAPASGVSRFRYAAKRMNDPSFRTPVYGNRSKWVRRVGKPRWFDDVAMARKNDFQDAVTAALDAMARRIAEKTRTHQ